MGKFQQTNHSKLIVASNQLPEKSVVSWQIKSFPGGKEFLMRASFGLPSVESEEVEGKPPIQVVIVNKLFHFNTKNRSSSKYHISPFRAFKCAT